MKAFRPSLHPDAEGLQRAQRSLETFLTMEKLLSTMSDKKAITRAAKNVAWVHDTLQKLVTYPRLLENRTFLIGTLRSLIKSLDADSNPVMAPLKVQGDSRRI